MPRVFLIAEAANPEWTSVPLIGWSLSRALAKLSDVHLVTHIRNREAIKRAGLMEDKDFTAIDNENIARPFWKIASRLRGGSGKGWTTITAFSALAYYSFENLVWRQFKTRFKAHEFDLVHRITPLSPTHQSPIAKKLVRYNIPFVIGPLNGGVPWPKGFMGRQHAEREWLSHARGLFRLMPAYRSTRKYSSAIIAGSHHTLDEMPAWAKDKCVYIPENAVDPARFNMARNHIASLPLKCAFVGRLVPYKGADMLLEAAVEHLRDGKLLVKIIGDGPQREALEAMVENMGIRHAVQFCGWIPHTEVQQKLAECDFMALPSVREFGGGVVIEAMALGVPPLVADYGGPAELVNDQTGFRVKFSDKETLVAGFKQVIGNLIRTPEILGRLEAAGRAKVHRSLTWDAKARQIQQIYDAVLNGQSRFSSFAYAEDAR
jgi:glycosyltransferase involved in cell wall biosynthesis